MTDTDPPQPEFLRTEVFCGDRYKPFGEVTIADARTRGEEMREVGGWGPLAKVAGVAKAWRELAVAMREAGAETVAELDRERAEEFAGRLWVVPPGGSLL